MADLTFYTNPMSRGRVARWMLEEVAQPYETVILDYATTMKGPEYLAINPMGKVPAIRHDGRTVTECAAICAYLADAFPGAGLAPEPGDRADYYRWLFFAAGPLEQAVTNHAVGWDPDPEKKRMFGYGDYADTVTTLERALDGREWIAGPAFTAADVYVGAAVTWGTQFGTLPARPAFLAYRERLSARTAFRRADALDDAAAEKLKAGAST
ncbi:MAG: glutathione S-transferase family protein [Rhodobacteraceae bacterium]|jgi:glutathione S-transferase|nr:glutathione S-transferase family protein [Paracoccaceae bacterium]